MSPRETAKPALGVAIASELVGCYARRAASPKAQRREETDMLVGSQSQ